VPTAPVSVTNPYLMRASPPSWPTGISVVPAAMLAADVLPEYYYGLGRGGFSQHPAFHGSTPAMEPNPHYQAHHHHHHHPPASSVPQRESLPVNNVSRTDFVVWLSFT